MTLDASPSSGSPGVIGCFTFGPVADTIDALEPAERRRAVLDALTSRLGPRAASPVEFIETPWWKEEWTRGLLVRPPPPGHPLEVRTAAPRAVGPRALGRHRDRDRRPRRDGRRRPLRPTRRHRDPLPQRTTTPPFVPKLASGAGSARTGDDSRGGYSSRVPTPRGGVSSSMSRSVQASPLASPRS